MIIMIITITVMIARERFRPAAPGLASEAKRGGAQGQKVGKGQTGSALMGSLQISCYLTEGIFGYSR